MTNKTPSDQGVRQRALAVDSSFLVEAPAGSGKTELLTDRILALLATVAKPEEIVAITFTRKAAAEMHQRVLEKLAAAQGPEPKEPHRRHSWQLARQALARDTELGWGLLDYPARLSIRTIDGLCAHLVQAMPWSSGLGGMPAIAEQPKLLYEQAARQTALDVESDQAVADVLRHLDFNFGRWEDLLVDMLGKRDQWLPELGHLDDTQQLEANLYDLVEEHLQRLLAAMPLGWAQDLAPLARHAIEVLQAGEQPCDFAALQDWAGEPLDATAASLAQWQALANFLLNAQGGLRARIDKRQGFLPRSAEKEKFEAWLNGQRDQSAAWSPLLDQVRRFPLGYTEEQRALMPALVRVLLRATAHLHVIFAQQRAIDFIEIAQRALFALGRADDPTELLLQMDRRIQHLLIDEFQDTSHVQMNILERLLSGWEPGDGRTVFLVGDPMQSIYRFRKAEVGLFLAVKVQQRIANVPVKVLQLKENFRSHPELVRWMNESGPLLLGEHNDIDVGAVQFNPAQAFQPGDGAAVHYHDFWNVKAKEEGAETPDNGDLRLQASQQKVIELCREALATYAERPRPVGILVRSRPHLDGLVRLLGEAGIPCRAVEVEALDSRPAVQDLIQLVRALVHPGDKMAWLALLRSPLCGLSLASIYALNLELAPDQPILGQLMHWAQWEKVLEADDCTRLQHFVHGLLSVPNRSGRLPFAAWVHRLWVQLEGPGIYPQHTDLADIEQALRLLESLAPYGQLDLDAFETQLGKLYAAPQNTTPAVEVMTIHKSKGLEFEVVILFGLHRLPRSDQTPLLSIELSEHGLLVGAINRKSNDSDGHPDISSLLREREKLRAQNELRRLLYVALTRAREAMHLVLCLDYDADKGQIKNPDSRTLLSQLWPVVQSDIASPQFDEAEAPVALPTEHATAGNLLHRRPAQSLAHEAIKNAWQQWQQQQEQAERLGAHNQWQWDMDSQDEAAAGQVAHAWLERIARDGLGSWPAERLATQSAVIERQLLRHGCSRQFLATGVQQVMETLQKTLASERGQWLLSVAQAQREWSLMDYSGRVSIIDLAIEQQDHWLIVDYKTTIPHEGEGLDAFAQRMLLRYQEQLTRYCEQVTALDGRPAQAALYFPRIDYWLPHEN